MYIIIYSAWTKAIIRHAWKEHTCIDQLYRKYLVYKGKPCDSLSLAPQCKVYISLVMYIYYAHLYDRRSL